MKLILTEKELVNLSEVALKAHHLTGRVLIELGETLDVDTLAMTDTELLNEVIEDAKASIESIGGYVRKSAINEYTVVLPENMTCEYLDMAKRATVEVVPFIVKAYKFGQKHYAFLKKVFDYSKSMARYFCTSPESKEMQKDIEELESFSKEVENKLKGIFSARG